MGEQIKIYIKEHGIKKGYLAKQMGISKKKLKKVLKGERDVKVVEYYAMCEALGISLDYFQW